MVSSNEAHNLGGYMVELDEFDEEWEEEEEAPFDEFLFERYRRKMEDRSLVHMSPSQFTSFAMRMPDSMTGAYAQFSFSERRHMKKPYDTSAPRVLLVCARQTEKSCVETSYISMSTGLLRRAGEIRVGDKVATLDVAGGGHTMTSGRVAWKSERYTKPCVRIKTRQGHEAEVAVTHPMRVWDGWRDAGDVKVGDRLAVVRRCGEFGPDFDVEDARIALTAYFIGDGYLGKRVSFTSNEGPKLDDFLSYLRIVGDSFYNGVRGVSHCIQIPLAGKTARWFSEDGLRGKLAAHKFLPEWVFSLSRKQAALFLNRLYATDGSVKKRKSEYNIVYASMSERLIRDVQAMLWKFGIPSRIRENWPNIYKKRGEKKLVYLLRVETQEGARKFLTEIGALGKSENIPLPTSEESSNRDTYPIEINELISRIIAYRGSDGRYGPTASGSLRSAHLREKLEYAPSPSKLQRYVDFFRKDSRYAQDLVDLLEKHVHTDLFWDEVEEIEHLGNQTCVDFSVEDTQNFVADGFVTHNSTLLGNKALSYCCLIPSYKVLYVSPSSLQTKTFSSDRIKEPTDTSDILTSFTTGQLAKNVFEKQFINRSKITLRYSYLTADRTRGIAAYMLDIDEIQDIIYDNIPVIEQCTSHAPEIFKRYVYSGTPKSLDNTIEYLRAQQSTQGEWVVPCDAHGGETGRYWNVLGEKNIGKTGLICEGCGARIDPAHKDAQWASMVQYRPEKEMYESYRIPQLMVPWKPWPELLHQYETYPIAQFYNEVLGISYDSGLRPLTLSQVREYCKDDVSMFPADVAKYARASFAQPVFMGVDWGSGEHSFTVAVLATYVNMKFRVFYAHRFTGKEAEPQTQLEILCELATKFNAAIIGTDYGGGFTQNDHLMRKFGPQRVHKFQYMARCKKKVEWDGKLLRWKAHRTETMSDLFNAIKRGAFEFPRWEEFQIPYAQDMCNIFSEYNEQLRMVQYMHSPDRPDDTFHALLYCFLGSMIKIPRPDVITPRREEPGKGPLFGNSGWAPLDQGSEVPSY